MSVPGIVQSTLDGEEIVTRVSLGGDDELFVSPSHTLLYRSDGLLSDESVDSFPHDADRLAVSEGRRKARFSLEYSLDGTREFTIPTGNTDAVLHPVLAGVLNGNGITDPGESVLQTYRFSELTVIVTSKRLVKHIGEAVWDGDFEEFAYADVTGLSFEPGSVATQVVLEVDGRQQRIKAPNENAAELEERLKQAIFAFHDVTSLEALHEKVGLEDDADDSSPTVDFGEGVAPLGAESTSDRSTSEVSEPSGTTIEGGASGEGVTAIDTEAAADSPEPETQASSDGSTTVSSEADAAPENDRTQAVDRSSSTTDERSSATDAGSNTDDDTSAAEDSVDDFEDSGFEPATATDEDVLERLEALEAAVERQSAILDRQQGTIEQLIEELRRSR